MRTVRLFILGILAAALLAWAVPAMATQDAARATTVKVTEGKPSEFGLGLSLKKVAHGTVTFAVTNSGNLPHDFKINGKKTRLLSPGQTQNLKVTFAKAGKYAYLCTVTGHALAGMKGVLTVT